MKNWITIYRPNNRVITINLNNYNIQSFIDSSGKRKYELELITHSKGHIIPLNKEDYNFILERIKGEKNETENGIQKRQNKDNNGV